MKWVCQEMLRLELSCPFFSHPSSIVSRNSFTRETLINGVDNWQWKKGRRGKNQTKPSGRFNSCLAKAPTPQNELLWTEWSCSLPPPRFICIWRWGLWEAIRVKWSREGVALAMEWVPFSEEITESVLPPFRVHSRRQIGHVDTTGRRQDKPGREPLPEPSHAGALISDFQPPELWEHTFLLWSYFV